MKIETKKTLLRKVEIHWWAWDGEEEDEEVG
jgi:hypothetical protein